MLDGVAPSASGSRKKKKKKKKILGLEPPETRKSKDWSVGEERE